MKRLILKRKKPYIIHNNNGIRLVEQSLHEITFIFLSLFLPQKTHKNKLDQYHIDLMN
jgi:hypothetical protein